MVLASVDRYSIFYNDRVRERGNTRTLVDATTMRRRRDDDDEMNVPSSTAVAPVSK